MCPTDLQGLKPSSPIDRKNSSKLSDDDDSNLLSSGAIAGIVTGCLSALAVVVIVSILVRTEHISEHFIYFFMGLILLQ